MLISTKQVRSVISELDWLIKLYKKEQPEQKRDWRTYEQQYARNMETTRLGLVSNPQKSHKLLALTRNALIFNFYSSINFA